MTFTYRPGAGLRLRVARGVSGAAATITAGTTTTAAEGTSAAVANSGTTAAAVFDFTIPRGAMPAVGWNFDTSTTDADPGAGDVRFNNATPASVTEIYIDNADRDGTTQTTWLDSWDDSTATIKGTLVIVPAATPSAKLVYNVTGSIVDGTGYRKVTVSHVAGTTLPSSGVHLGVDFSRSGNNGANGTNGTMAGPVSSTDNAIARFNGTDGTTVQDSVVTIADTTGTIAPVTTDSGALGTATNMWADLFLASGAVVNFNNGDVTLTHSADDLALAGGTLTLPNTGLHILDTNASHDLIIAPGSNITADRTFTLTTGDANRTLDISAADTTISSFATTVLDDTTAAAALTTLTARGQGLETIFIPASAMTARTTNGAAAGTAEMSTNKNMFKTLDFDTTTQEFAQFEIWFPKSWNLGTVTFQPVWSHAATTTNFGVVWGLAGVARSDDDAGDVAFGTAQTSTDTGGTTNDIYLGPTSSAITIAGTPAAGDTVQFQINRTVSDGSDTMGIDARLHGVRLFFTTNAATDA